MNTLDRREMVIGSLATIAILTSPALLCGSIQKDKLDIIIEGCLYTDPIERNKFLKTLLQYIRDRAEYNLAHNLFIEIEEFNNQYLGLEYIGGLYDKEKFNNQNSIVVIRKKISNMINITCNFQRHAEKGRNCGVMPKDADVEVLTYLRMEITNGYYIPTFGMVARFVTEVLDNKEVYLRRSW